PRRRKAAGGARRRKAARAARRLRVGQGYTSAFFFARRPIVDCEHWFPTRTVILTLVPSSGRFGNFRLTARKITRPLFRLTNRPSRRPPAKVPSLSQKLNRRGVGRIQWPAGTVAQTT